MAQEDGRWREKYRQALAQQEQLEKTLTAQQALMHRAVIALSNAAEGHDSEIDKRMSAIRASLKKNDVGGFDRMIKAIPRVIDEAEQYREKQWTDVYKSLGNISGTLQSVGGETKTAAKSYKKSIPKGALLPATLKRLLDDLGSIQKQAIQESQGEAPSTGLISRLFGKSKEEGNSGKEHPDDKDNTEHQEWEEVDESDYSPKATLIKAENSTDEPEAPKHRVRSEPEAVLNRPLHEPAFSRISDRLTIILVELLDHFPTVPCVEQKSKKARERIDRGLNWYELVPTLEDIRDFVIQSYIGADNDYRLYLSNVYSELSNITEALGLAIDAEASQRTQSLELHQHVNEGIDHLQQALKQNDNIDQLKHAVESQVQTIQGALDEFQKKQNNSLSDQLDTLIQQVKSMEEQDADIRKQLEVEKKKAITDKLTGLPNREAYSERVHEELTRWQRYQHPLTLAVLDIDFFKKVNDSYGHQTGDKVLQVVAKSVAKRLREVDFIARFGGEEFVLLLPETSAEQALGMLNQIRERLSKTPLRYKEEKITVTVSIGISQFTDSDNAEDVFARADKALYDAKENGRNQCCLGEAEPPPQNKEDD